MNSYLGVWQKRLSSTSFEFVSFSFGATSIFFLLFLFCFIIDELLLLL